jgi:hypothetical protein
MIKRIISGLLLTTILSAPAVAAQLPSRTPGLWQSTTTVTGPDGRPLAGAGSVVTVSCVDALDDQGFFTAEKSACSKLAITGSGNSYNIDGVCTGQGQNMTIHESLLYAGPQALQLNAVYNSPSGQITVTSQLAWQGNCLPGMQPGDEGSLNGTVFTKTDNINDSANQ